jgi:hypothetical protein
MKIPPDEVGQLLNLLGRFLQEKQVRPLSLHERSDVLDSGAGQAQQIPADDLQSDFPFEADPTIAHWRYGDRR